jgi:hypothetical protein
VQLHANGVFSTPENTSIILPCVIEVAQDYSGVLSIKDPWQSNTVTSAARMLLVGLSR